MVCVAHCLPATASSDASLSAQGKDPNDDVDHLATSIDYEVERLGLERIDILKLSISSLDILRTYRSPNKIERRVFLSLTICLCEWCGMFSFSSWPVRSATRTLQKTNRILLALPQVFVHQPECTFLIFFHKATDPRDTMMQVQFLKAAGFEERTATRRF